MAASFTKRVLRVIRDKFPRYLTSENILRRASRQERTATGAFPQLTLRIPSHQNLLLSHVPKHPRRSRTPETGSPRPLLKPHTARTSSPVPYRLHLPKCSWRRRPGQIAPSRLCAIYAPHSSSPNLPDVSCPETSSGSRTPETNSPAPLHKLSPRTSSPSPYGYLTSENVLRRASRPQQTAPTRLFATSFCAFFLSKTS